MKLAFYGGVSGSVTGANYFSETQKVTKILVDCGMFQGSRFAEEQNHLPFAYKPEEIQAVFITHAHIDHIGRLPKLYKDGFRGKVYSTKPTRDLAELNLMDSAHLIGEEAEETGAPPLFNAADVANVMGLFEGIDYGNVLNPAPDIKVRFRDAGHILGSAIIELWGDGKKVVFSGDLGNPPTPLLKPTEFIDEADYVLVEAAYGNRVHEDFKERKSLLEDQIEYVGKKNGVLMIPIFALERTQELLFELNELIENKRVPPMPVFIDSPLAINATEVYKKYPGYFNKEAMYLIESGDQIFNWPGLKMTKTVEESKAINDVSPPKVIVAGSGMSNGGRIRHHERRYLQDPNSLLLIIGYQVAGSLGRRLLDGAKEIKMFGETVPVRAKIAAIGGYSAHADQPKLFDWVSHIKNLKQVFTVQGEEAAAKALASLIQDNLAVRAEAPILGEVVEL
ncbi:MBL fold metallo-hydrolase [Candidatus Uhrbacteria bacterium]|nr:MBL fold metallo-hydrolase [Candidatus Uhrbacteria bacterium]